MVFDLTDVRVDEEISFKESSLFCNTGNYDLFYKRVQRGDFGSIEVRLVQTKKSKIKTLQTESLPYGPGVQASLTLSQIKNGKGLSCSVKTL